MTVARDLDNRNKVNARKGESVMKLVRTSILKHLTFNCMILERLEKCKRMVCWMAKLPIQQLFSI